jgi:predicted metal-dependent HD superfamily phosphohydrolase
MDKQRFEKLWLRCARDAAAAEPQQFFAQVQQHYNEPHRRYHTPAHITHCLTQFDAARTQMQLPDTVELAIWYHDVIYDVGAADNELQSARLLRRHAQGVMPEELVQCVHDLIMVTVHGRQQPATPDQGYMVDIDLSSFGLPWPRFLRDSVAVREEFPHMSDAQFYPRQREFLSSLLARESFCITAFFRKRHETRARKNITRYLADLEARGLV